MRVSVRVRGRVCIARVWGGCVGVCTARTCVRVCGCTCIRVPVCANDALLLLHAVPINLHTTPA